MHEMQKNYTDARKKKWTRTAQTCGSVECMDVGKMNAILKNINEID